MNKLSIQKVERMERFYGNFRLYCEPILVLLVLGSSVGFGGQWKDVYGKMMVA